MKNVENQTGPANEADDRDGAVREHDRVIYMARRSQDQRVGSDLLGAAIIIVVLALFGVGAWILWALVLSHPAH